VTAQSSIPPKHVPLDPYVPPTDAEAASRAFYDVMRRRRTVRMFSDRAVPRSIIEDAVRTAGTAPSGANKQPWRFVCVDDPELKREIRVAAEEEERAFYAGRANDDWLRDLQAIGTDDRKPFLEEAPWLVIVFKLMRDDHPGRHSDQVYYVNESVGLAVGMFLLAAHQAGLATLTHTPSPMKFLARVLGRAEHERPFLLIPVGYPAEGTQVPDIQRKELDEILVYNRGRGSKG
jgi:nitroreductase